MHIKLHDPFRKARDFCIVAARHLGDTTLQILISLQSFMRYGRSNFHIFFFFRGFGGLNYSFLYS